MIADIIKKAIIFSLHLWFVNGGVMIFYSVWYRKLGWSNPPLDFGKNCFDGKRVLGDSKTFLGMFVMIFLGCFIGFLFSTPFFGLVIGLTAFAGTVASSFIKRRLSINRGMPFPFLDQSDYLLSTFIIFNLVGLEFNLIVFLLVFWMSLVVHILANIVAFRLNLKDVPW